MTQNNTPAQSEQKITLENLHNAFARLCFSYSDLNSHYGFNEQIDSMLIDWLLADINSLAQVVEGLRFKGGF